MSCDARGHDRWATRALVAAAMAVMAAACGVGATNGSRTAPTPVTAAATTVPSPAGWYPLTGLGMADLALGEHPAVVVKMDNSPQARPQAAINQADVVFEERVEGITRYAVVFHSTLPDLVGPVRSARTSDIDLIAGLGRPLLAWSGANPIVSGQVAAAVRAGLFVDASRGANPPEYWRDNTRDAPHNLFTSVTQLLARFGAGSATPPQAVLAFAARGTTSAPTALDLPGVTIDFGGGVRVQYVWDAQRHGWDRFQVDELHPSATSATVDTSGQQVSPTNVVVLSTRYVTSVADARSPQAITVGSGDGYVLTQGRAIAVRWSRTTNTSAFTFATPSGEPVALTPGRTWVAMPAVGAAVSPIDRPTADWWLALRR